MQLPLIGKLQRPNPWMVGLILTGLLGTGGIAYSVLQQKAAVPDIASLTVPVKSEPLQVQIDASGTVQPIQTVNLSPKNAGIVAKLFVEQGDRVSKGQVVARMQNDDIDAQLTQSRARIAQAEARLAQFKAGNRPEEIAQAEARVSQARAQVTEAQARLNLAQDKQRRNQSLADEGAISSDRFNEFSSEVATARASVEQSQANLAQLQRSLDLSRNGSRVEEVALAQAQLDEAIGNLQSVQVNQEDTLVRAPFSGTITQKFANVGAFVTPTTSASEATSATSTAIVALAEGLEVLAEVPEVDIQQLQIGQLVEVRADAYPDLKFQGKVRRIAPEAVVRQNVTSFQVRILLVTGQEKLLSGMNVDVTFLGKQIDSTLVIPTVAIVTQEGQTGVLVPDKSNQPEFRPVTLGVAVGNQTQVLEGVQPGDKVFTDIPPNSNWGKQE
ncbi:MAG: efflux RND transporter periplasmic adaptor subunit [Drouetiella hepatica Uher 2000/2452]|uniref:Efflux RND transporter periplasmic adaptor subunit n=1 Tax=Drouetiella hepatica Uher 2000/2452 TaxID=904376 RepID=A0A951QDG6_9CYAN|nr:efflux RND transporter periplasmic adaptor subunit [Drouetiella hepatica Uher 2000/2452]